MYLDLYECFFFIKQISNESVTNNALTRAGGRKCVTSHKVSLSDVMSDEFNVVPPRRLRGDFPERPHWQILEKKTHVSMLRFKVKMSAKWK